VQHRSACSTQDGSAIASLPVKSIKPMLPVAAAHHMWWFTGERVRVIWFLHDVDRIREHVEISSASTPRGSSCRSDLCSLFTHGAGKRLSIRSRKFGEKQAPTQLPQGFG